MRYTGPVAECGCPLVVPPRCLFRLHTWFVIHYHGCEHHDSTNCLACKEIKDG